MDEENGRVLAKENTVSSGGEGNKAIHISKDDSSNVEGARQTTEYKLHTSDT